MARKGFDVPDLDIPERTAILPNTGSVDATKVSAELMGIEVVDKPMASDLQAELAFLEEPVEVMVHESTDPNSENPVQVAVNGINQFFMRGQVQTVRRKYLAVLAGARKSSITTPEVTQGGERTAAIRRVSALAYPFSVIHDPNPRGPVWLKQIMQEA